jgi:hypothetical protein
MKLVNWQTMIRDVADRWAAQYPASYRKQGSHYYNVHQALLALPEGATGEDVARIIGNTSWVHDPICGACGQKVSKLVALPLREMNLDEVCLCKKCLARALGMLL